MLEVVEVWWWCVVVVVVGGGSGGGGWRVVEAEGGRGGGWWRQRVALYPHCIFTVSPLYPYCILTVSRQREMSAESCGVGRWWAVVAGTVEGGRGGGWRSMTLYPHCIPNVSSLYPSKESRKVVGGGGGGGRRRVVGGGGGGWHCILTVSPLYPHCILTVSLQREVSVEAKKEGRRRKNEEEE